MPRAHAVLPPIPHSVCNAWSAGPRAPDLAVAAGDALKAALEHLRTRIG